MKFIFKAGLLVSLLAVPVFIYLFLQFFGQNNYELAVYYQEDFVIDSSSCSSYTYKTPHRVSFSMVPLNFEPSEKIIVVSFLPMDCDENCQVKLNLLQRLADQFESEPDVHFVSIVSGSNKEAGMISDRENNNWSLIKQLSDTIIDDLMYCQLLLQNSDITTSAPFDQFVLLDRQNRIRGYYDALSLEEADRITLETRILLYEHEHQTRE